MEVKDDIDIISAGVKGLGMGSACPSAAKSSRRPPESWRERGGTVFLSRLQFLGIMKRFI